MSAARGAEWYNEASGIIPMTMIARAVIFLALEKRRNCCAEVKLVIVLSMPGVPRRDRRCVARGGVCEGMMQREK